MSLVQLGKSKSRHDDKDDLGEQATQKLEGYRRTSYAVWEITLKCNLACAHCGSRAGDARDDELSTEECYDLVDQMAEAGIGEVSLIGGEAYLRADWLDIARRITERGMIATMTTGGLGISHETARQMKRAGIARVSVSVDGLEDTHDAQRGKKGAWEAAFRALHYFREVGLYSGTNTQINRLSAPQLPTLYEKLLEAGSSAWQLQMTVPMGNAADNGWMLLQPVELLDVYPMLARIVSRMKADKQIAVAPGNNIGYYGPYERHFRGRASDPYGFWMGCQAGLYALGIEADGAIKGCPSLPTTAYTGGNIRDHALADILSTKELTMNMGGGTPEGVKHLWGFCKTCDYADLCRGGCSWTAHVFFDRRGNNPYCHHRALEHAKKGTRERVILNKAAPGTPFDNGEFALVTEALEAPWPEDDLDQHFTLDKVEWGESWEPHGWFGGLGGALLQKV